MKGAVPCFAYHCGSQPSATTDHPAVALLWISGIADSALGVITSSVAAPLHDISVPIIQTPSSRRSFDFTIRFYP
jgi:hypothetical protein